MRTLKLSKKMLFIAIFLFVGIIVFLGIGTYYTDKKDECFDYHELIKESKDTSDTYVSLNITDLPYEFGVEEKNDKKYKYYFVSDSNYMYIVRLTDRVFNDIKSIYDKGEAFSYQVKGYLFETPSELKKLAIDTYNEGNDSNFKLTNDNYEDYLGSTYMDIELTPYTDFVSISNAAAIICFTFMLICILLFIISLCKYKKAIKKYDLSMLESLINESDTLEYRDAKIYLTRKYLISTLYGLTVLDYNDILWMYTVNRHYNRVETGVSLIAVTKDFKSNQIGNIFKNKEMFLEIMKKTNEYNSNIKLGYTDDNINYFKKLKKNG